MAYCSRTLTAAERRYTQIEKECLTAVLLCERFDRYLVGLEQFALERDHKLLVPIINQKDLSETPLRCQRMLMRLTRSKVQGRYTRGKTLHVADTLSRSPLSEGQPGQLHEDVGAHVNAVTSSWSVSDTFLDRIRTETEKDVDLNTAVQYTVSGRPHRHQNMSDLEIFSR